MGGFLSSHLNKSETEYYPVTVTDYALYKVANNPPASGAKGGKKCSTDQYCKIEETEINALNKMKAMDDANTKKWNLTKENFDTTWNSFMKNCSHVLSLYDTPTFSEEREHIATAFSGTSSEIKQDASIKYKEAVDGTLANIAKRRAMDPKQPTTPPGGSKK